MNNYAAHIGEVYNRMQYLSPISPLRVLLQNRAGLRHCFSHPGNLLYKKGCCHIVMLLFPASRR